MNANDLARMSVCHHLPRLCISTSQLPRCCVENGRLGRSRQLPAPTLQPWPTSCLNSSCDMLLLHCYIAQAPESLCLNVTSSIVTLIFTSNTWSFSMAAVLSIAKVFWRSSKCYSVTARALKQDTAISDSSGSFFGGAGARRAKACERIRIHPRMSSARSCQTAQMHMIWLDLPYIFNSGLDILMHLVW